MYAIANAPKTEKRMVMTFVIDKLGRYVINLSIGYIIPIPLQVFEALAIVERELILFTLKIANCSALLGMLEIDSLFTITNALEP